MHGAKKTKTIQICVTPAMYDRWEQASIDFDMTHAQFIRSCVELFINNKDTMELQGRPVQLMGRVSHRYKAWLAKQDERMRT